MASPSRGRRSTSSTVRRPVVRSFKQAFQKQAAAWVRAGGHAVVWESSRRAWLVLPPIDPDDEGDFGLWSLLDLGKQRARIEERGTLKGLARALVPADCLDIVRRRAERDSEHPEPTRTVDFDCLACGACCRDNEVVLFEDDVTRLKEGGHAKLTRPPYARRRKGKLVLTLLANKSCRQLGKDNACAIYASRPAACRDFPMGSECCLYSREAEFGWVDGVAAGA